ncbi:hypothetical protein FDP41_003326 [Naegleria fowleri]|uniref:Uncharacterized protein n=1 Tax=Naegleria fowleri TaxID=5763 RepID=A0A6A5BSZ4_NAEFO|nr:uncharacterized protein FDP41_003326 [Naegleria fowleri]KAF0977334.1 hypothetical protein FDP41_003326 [Naegleria fowleri]
MTDDHPSLITKIAHLEKYIEYLQSTMNDLTKVINDMIEKQLHEPTSNLKINDNPPNDESVMSTPIFPQTQIQAPSSTQTHTQTHTHTHTPHTLTHNKKEQIPMKNKYQSRRFNQETTTNINLNKKSLSTKDNSNSEVKKPQPKKTPKTAKMQSTRPTTKKSIDFNKGLTIYCATNLYKNKEALQFLLNHLKASKLAKDPWVPSERPFILQIVPSSSSSRDEIIKNLNTAKSQTNFKYFISDMSLQITEFTAQHLTGNDENNILHMISCLCNWHEKSKGLIAMRISKPPDSSCFKTTVTVKNLQSLQEILSNTEWFRLKTYTQLAEDSRFEVFIDLSTDFEEHEIVNVVKDITTKAGITIHPNSIKIDEKASPFNPEESYYNIIVSLKSDTEVDRILEVVHPIETKHGRIITKSFKSKAQYFKEKAISKSSQSTEKESSNFSTITTPNIMKQCLPALKKESPIWKAIYHILLRIWKLNAQR